MIDIETLVFNAIATMLRAQFAGISVYGEAVELPAKFPCVTIEQSDNSVYQRTQDSSSNENHASLMYSVNVYSNQSNAKKTQAKEIMAAIDVAMLDMRFTRVSCSPIPNGDKSIYRLNARYAAVVAAGVNNGTNTVYQMYGR